MKKVISFLAFVIFITNSVSAAEAGMPQLDPTYWASQVFWLAIIFSSIYFLIAKIFIPKIKSNIDAREDKIRKDIEEANLLKEEADKKLKKYNALIEEAKVSAKKIISDSRKKLNEDIQIKRASQRDNKSREDIINIMKNQVSREERKSIADNIILNNSTLNHLKENILKTHQRLLGININE